MSRLWKDVKADKEKRDRSAGRDTEAVQEHARALTNAHVLRYRLAHRRAEDHRGLPIGLGRPGFGARSAGSLYPVDETGR